MHGEGGKREAFGQSVCLRKLPEEVIRIKEITI